MLSGTILLSLIALFHLSQGQVFQCVKYNDPSIAVEFEYFLFVQENSGAFCIFNNCSRNTTKLWTIHGLWPTTDSDPVPLYCGGMEAQFNLSSLQAIMPQLRSNWPGLKLTSEKFWQHEWCKHGTCALSMDALNTEIKFFTTALKLYDMYPIESILQKHGVIPSSDGGKTYKIDDFNNAFLEEINAAPLLECHIDEMGNQLLFQVEICMNKQLNPVTCSPNLHRRDKKTVCPPDEYIYYVSNNI